MTAAKKRAPKAETLAAEERQAHRDALAALVDVTSEFADLAKEDRVFRSPDGWLVKVKQIHDVKGQLQASAPGLVHFTGSIVGPDGKTLRREDGTLAVRDAPQDRQTWSHVGHRRTRRPAEARDIFRRQCALQTIIQEEELQLLQELDGYDTAEGFAARKAAEAGEVPLEPDALLEGEDPEADPPALDAEPEPPPAPAKHPSGRRYLLFPGNVLAGDATVHLTAKQLAEARGLALGQCVVFSPKRPHTYYAGLEEVVPHPDDATATSV